MSSHAEPTLPTEKVDLNSLLRLFYPADSETLAVFERAELGSLPETPHQLLDHDAHMTITVEAFHGSPVNVRVLQTRESPPQDSPPWYAREILLTREDNGSVVQYGIVRLWPDRFQPQTWDEIRAGLLPLGRILIQHDVFRQVERIGLWKIIAGPRLAELLQVAPGSITYGRTARILCDHVPAIELLEIVAPAD